MRKRLVVLGLGLVLLFTTSSNARAVKGDDCYWLGQALANHLMQLSFTNGDLAFAQLQVSMSIQAGAQSGDPWLNYLVGECVRLEGLANYWQGQVDATETQMNVALCY